MSKIMCKLCAAAIFVMLFNSFSYASTVDSNVMKGVRFNLWYQGIENSIDVEYDSPEKVELGDNNDPEYPVELLIPLVREMKII